MTSASFRVLHFNILIYFFFFNGPEEFCDITERIENRLQFSHFTNRSRELLPSYPGFLFFFYSVPGDVSNARSKPEDVGSRIQALLLLCPTLIFTLYAADYIISKCTRIFLSLSLSLFSHFLSPPYNFYFFLF